MARLNTSERTELPDNAFAYVDSRGRRRLPIHDEAHVRNALSRFNQVSFESEAARERARERLLKAAKKHGIVPIGFINGQLQSERHETRRILRDLREAQAIQAGLLPVVAPEIPNFSVTGLARPCRAVGGDWYDYMPLPDGRLAVVLADVSGKGMGAALLMSSTRSIVRMVAQGMRSPGEVLDDVNRVLVGDLPAAKFVTMIFAILDPTDRTVTFASAGHHPPILVDAWGARPLRVRPQLALGIREGVYAQHQIEMTPGSKLFLYSDGVVEARNAASEEYGEARLLDHVAVQEATPQSLLDDVAAFMKRRSAVDDITIVMIEARG